MFTILDHRKRARENDNEGEIHEGLLEKKARPTAETSHKWNQRDSVIGPSAVSLQAREPYKFDSDDDRASSNTSDASTRDVSMSSDDEGMDSDAYAQSLEGDSMGRTHGVENNPWASRLQTNRVATPIAPPRPGNRPGQIRTSFMTHVRQRHPQEYQSEHLEVPSPIDEDEVPTPPSAAEAAGSQLSMLSVNDVDMDTPDNVPTISIDPARPTQGEGQRSRPQADTDVHVCPMDGDPAAVVVRKQRQRSGALSGGNSPVRAGPSNVPSKRGFAMGFRADCEKCRMRVPGHMNHFIA